MFIYKDKSLVLAKFRRKNDAVSVEYYENKANADFSLKDQVARNTARYQELYTLTDLLLQYLEACQIFFVLLMDFSGSVVRCGGFCAD